MGLGVLDLPTNAPLRDYSESLSDIRKRASYWRSVVADNKDPISVRQQQKAEASKQIPTLERMMADTLSALSAKLKGGGKAGRWDSPLRLHVLPSLGKRSIESINQQDIKNTLKKIWNEKPETARKAMNRLGLVFKHATAAGYSVDLQAVEKARILLGPQKNEVRHIPSMHWKDVPEFYASLEGGGHTELALQLLILTAARPGEVRGLHEDELSNGVWVLPGNRTKSAREHSIPISQEASRIIERAREFSRDGYLFPGVRKGVISDMTLNMFMKRRGLEARAHGFRSSFRVWCSEAANVPRELAEMSLAHSVGSKVEQAYQRSDLLERRRIILERWANHVIGGHGQLVDLVHRGI